MPKCIKKGDKVIRVNDEKAWEMVRADVGWEYCSETEYRK